MFCLCWSRYVITVSSLCHHYEIGQRTTMGPASTRPLVSLPMLCLTCGWQIEGQRKGMKRTCFYGMEKHMKRKVRQFTASCLVGPWAVPHFLTTASAWNICKRPRSVNLVFIETWDPHHIWTQLSVHKPRKDALTPDMCEASKFLLKNTLMPPLHALVATFATGAIPCLWLPPLRIWINVAAVLDLPREVCCPAAPDGKSTDLLKQLLNTAEYSMIALCSNRPLPLPPLTQNFEERANTLGDDQCCCDSHPCRKISAWETVMSQLGKSAGPSQAPVPSVVTMSRHEGFRCPRMVPATDFWNAIPWSSCETFLHLLPSALGHLPAHEEAATGHWKHLSRRNCEGMWEMLTFCCDAKIYVTSSEKVSSHLTDDVISGPPVETWSQG